MIKTYLLGHTTPFVGRTKELAEITARLVDPVCRLLTLTGLGGSGKTRLATEAALSIGTHFQHGTVFVSLQPLSRSDLLVPTIAQALGLTFHGEGEPRSQLLDYLGEKTLLLLLDNFEHLLDGATLVNSMLNAAPGLKVLATSREALNLQEEWLYPLKGMATPPSVYATPFEDYEAVQLFLNHARRVQPGFDPARDYEALIRICRMTAGLPLALELAASWLTGLSATQIAHEIQCNLDFLSTTTRNVEERHRSMRAVFDQSWKLLSDSERRIFARLSIFRGGFNREAAEQIAGAALASLVALVEKSLVQVETPDRFGIHELLRQYSVEKLDDYGETEATHTSHSQYFAQLMLQHEVALKQPQQLEGMQAIERDLENIRLAWDWSTRNQYTAQLHAMLNGLYLFGFLRSRYRETIAIFERTLEQSVTDTLLLGRLLARRWGYVHWLYLADYQEALKQIQQALTIAEAEDDQFEIAFCQLMVGYTMISMQRYAEALPRLETSKARFEAINEPYYVCWVLHRLGYVCYTLHDSTRATTYTEQSLALARTTNNRFALVICLYNLGSAYIVLGDYVKGKQFCTEALHVATESGHQDQIAHSLSLLALCAFCQGDFATCQEYAEHSRAIIQTINSFIFEPYSLHLLILLACLREDYAEGVRLKESGKHHSTNAMGFQLLYWSLAVLSCGLGNLADVRSYIQQVLRLTDPTLNAGTIVWLVPCVVYVYAATQPAQAVELLAWAFAYPDTALYWAHQWPLFNRLQDQLQAGMESDRYHTHWEKGATLSFETISTGILHEFGASPQGLPDAPQHILTSREQEILHLLAAGMTNPQIAAQLVIGAGTVKTHTLNIYRKLDVANRTQAIVRAQELGLLHP